MACSGPCARMSHTACGDFITTSPKLPGRVLGRVPEFGKGFTFECATSTCGKRDERIARYSSSTTTSTRSIHAPAPFHIRAVCVLRWVSHTNSLAKHGP